MNGEPCFQSFDPGLRGLRGGRPEPGSHTGTMRGALEAYVYGVSVRDPAMFAGTGL